MGVPNLRLHDREQSSIDVLIACAEGDEAFLRSIPSMLNGGGVRPHIVAGVDRDPSVLTRALQRTHGPALVAVVIGRHLGRFQAHTLGQAFGAQRNALHRLLVCEIRRGDLRALATSIESAVEGLRSTPAAGPPAPPKRTTLEVCREPVAMPPQTPPHPIPVARTTLLDSAAYRIEVDDDGEPRAQLEPVCHESANVSRSSIQFDPRPAATARSMQISMGARIAVGVIIVSLAVLAAAGTSLVTRAVAASFRDEQRTEVDAKRWRVEGLHAEARYDGLSPWG